MSAVSRLVTSLAALAAIASLPTPARAVTCPWNANSCWTSTYNRADAACEPRPKARGASCKSGTVDGECDGTGYCYPLRTDWIEPLPPIVATILYSPAGMASLAISGSATTETVGFRFQVSNGSGTTLGLKVNNARIQGDFTLEQTTGYSATVYGVKGTAYTKDGRHDNASFTDNEYLIWWNPRLTQQTGPFTGNRRYIIDVDDGAHQDVWGPPTGVKIASLTGGQIAASSPPGITACHDAIWGDVHANQAAILEHDPYWTYSATTPPWPSLASYDVETGGLPRFVYLGLATSLGSQKVWGTRGYCAGQSSGQLLSLSLGHYKERRFTIRGTEVRFDFQFMSSSATCPSFYYEATIDTSTNCGLTSALAGDLYLDLVYGTVAFWPTRLPDGGPANCVLAP